MSKHRSAGSPGCYILFLENTVISADIAEEINLIEPKAPVRQVSNFDDFIKIISREGNIRASFIELDLLGRYWDAALDRLRTTHSWVVLFGDRAEDLAEREPKLERASYLLRPFSGRDVARILRKIPDA